MMIPSTKERRSHGYFILVFGNYILKIIPGYISFYSNQDDSVEQNSFHIMPFSSRTMPSYATTLPTLLHHL